LGGWGICRPGIVIVVKVAFMVAGGSVENIRLVLWIWGKGISVGVDEVVMRRFIDIWEMSGLEMMGLRE
jgi:hypothetical protein